MVRREDSKAVAPGFSRTGPCGTLTLSLWAEPCVWTCLTPSSQAGRPGLGLRPTRRKKRLRLRGTLQPAKDRTQPQPNRLCPRPRRLATGPSALTFLAALARLCTSTKNRAGQLSTWEDPPPS